MAADGYEAVLTNLFEEDLDTELAWRAHEVGPGSAASFLDSFEQAKDAAVSFPAFMPQVEGSIRYARHDRYTGRRQRPHRPTANTPGCARRYSVPGLKCWM